jgi:hypothetical protein
MGEKLYLLLLKDHRDCEMNRSFEGVVVADRTLVLKGRLLWVLKNSVEDGYSYGLFDPNSNETLELKGLWDR